MRLAYSGSVTSFQRSFEERFGFECPEWFIEERVARAFHNWTCVSEIFPGFGFYEQPIDSLEPVTPHNHRSEVFENELDYMTPVAADLVTELLEADCYVTEMPYANNYRTDLAICEIDADALRRRLRLTDGDDRSLVDEWMFLKSYRWFRTAGPVTKDEYIENGPYSSASTNRRVWNRLDDIGLLAFKGEYATAVNLPIHITAHAVELKQRDWETALKQARRAAIPHKESDHFAPNRHPKKYGYADRCWVVLDAGHIDEALANRNQFESANVGLIGLDEGGAVKLIDSGGWSPPERSLDREHLNEKTMDLIDVDEYVDRSALSRQAQLGEVTA